MYTYTAGSSITTWMVRLPYGGHSNDELEVMFYAELIYGIYLFVSEQDYGKTYRRILIKIGRRWVSGQLRSH